MASLTGQTIGAPDNTYLGVLKTSDEAALGTTLKNIEDGAGNTSGMKLSQNGLGRSIATGITASTTQTQGQQPLTKDVNVVSTVANANDVVTLPAPEAGREIVVINRAASNTLQIFPSTGVDLGAGANASTTLTAGASKSFMGVDSSTFHALT